MGEQESGWLHPKNEHLNSVGLPRPGQRSVAQRRIAGCQSQSLRIARSQRGLPGLRLQKLQAALSRIPGRPPVAGLPSGRSALGLSCREIQTFDAII